LDHNAIIEDKTRKEGYERGMGVLFYSVAYYFMCFTFDDPGFGDVTSFDDTALS
jgi:hypothetical protein